MQRPELRIADIASRQHGVVTRAQLLAAGLTRSMVDGRVRSGQLRRMHRGVYLLGSLTGRLEPVLAREKAAVLACGPSAVVSHETAAALWKLLPPQGRTASVHVTVAGVDRGRRPGIRAHRVDHIPRAHRATFDGVPVTSAARTLVDIAGRIRPRALEQAIAAAGRMESADLDDVLAAMKLSSHRRGRPVLRALIARRNRLPFTRSVAEERFLELVKQGGLPLPETNVRVGQDEVDFLWRSEGVVAEVDGFAYHSSRRMFENDRSRDARLAVLGFLVVRVTWRQLTDEPHALLVRLVRILDQASVRRGPAG